MEVKRALKNLFEIAREQPKYQITITFLGITSTIFASIVPFLLKDLFENLQSSTSIRVITSIILILLCYTFSIIVELGMGLMSNIAETRAGAYLKKRLLFKTMQLPWEYYQNHGKGEILSKALSDTERLGHKISFFSALTIEVCSLIIGVVILFLLNPAIGLLALFTLPIYFFSMRCFIGRLKEASKVERERYAQCVEVFRDVLDGLEEIKLFNASGHFKGKLDGIIEYWIFAVKKSALYQSINYGVQSYLSTLLPLVVLAAGALLVRSDSTSIGVVVAAFSYLGRLYKPIERLAYIWSGLLQSIPTMERVYDLLEYDCSTELHNRKPQYNNIKLAQVSWNYDTKHVLSNASLEINAREKIALVGQSGAGKSTIAWLILGLFQPQSGQILFDGVPITEYSADDLLAQIAYTSAHPHIFQGTIMENVSLGIEFPEKEISNVLDICGLGEMNLQKKLGEGSGDLSLGQKQRIGLARIMLRKPKIIILDEATSGVDSQVEEKILTELFKLDSIIIVMSHRLSTVKHCSRVALLWNGTIAEIGSHDDLLENNQNYRWIFQDQLVG